MFMGNATISKTPAVNLLSPAFVTSPATAPAASTATTTLPLGNAHSVACSLSLDATPSLTVTGATVIPPGIIQSQNTTPHHVISPNVVSPVDPINLPSCSTTNLAPPPASPQHSPHPQSSHPQSSPQRRNKPPTQLTLATKIEICKRFAGGSTVPAIMRDFNCARRTAFRIKKFQAYYLSLPQSETPYLRRIRNRTLLYPEIEKPLVNFVNVARSLKMPVTASIIQAKALALRDKAVSDCHDQARHDRLKGFKATEGWVAAFIKRNGLRSLKIDAHPSTTLTDASTLAAPTTPATLAQHLAPFSLDNIYTVDECILFYRLLPHTSYVFTKAGKRTLLSSPTMSVDDRISLYVSCNATGTSRVPLTLVGRHSNPACFGKQKPRLPYITQQNAWTDALTFRNWFLNVFLPHVQNHHTEHVALLLNDGSVFRNDVCDARGQVKLFLLPSGDGGAFGSTAHQPMSVGIVAALKTRYRHQLIQRTIENFETVCKRREIAQATKVAMPGICEGYEANLLDATLMLEKVWKDIPHRVIAHSWQIAKVLPSPMAQQLCVLHGAPDTSRPVFRDIETLQGLYNFVKELNQSRDLEGSGISFFNLSDHDVARWVGIEDDIEVCDALMNDNVAFLEGLTENAGTTETDDLIIDSFHEDLTNQYSLPPASQIAQAFVDVELLATNAGLSDALYHLRCAKQALLSEKSRSSKEEKVAGALLLGDDSVHSGEMNSV